MVPGEKTKHSIIAPQRTTRSSNESCQLLFERRCRRKNFFTTTKAWAPEMTQRRKTGKSKIAAAYSPREAVHQVPDAPHHFRERLRL